jgi:hypothetical protein
VADLQQMPKIVIAPHDLRPFGRAWRANNKALSRTPPHSSMQLGEVFDLAIGKALAKMLGGIPVVTPISTALLPGKKDCVEVGHCRIIGGIRPQNFDVGYRPDGVRFAFDTKTLNDSKSVTKNYQNMINDLGTESSTVHTRFPYAVVAFLVAIPEPCLVSPQREKLAATLERLTGRQSPVELSHKAEAIALVLWNPATGKVDSRWPKQGSPLRIEEFSRQVEAAYRSRYTGLPPHD